MRNVAVYLAQVSPIPLLVFGSLHQRKVSSAVQAVAGVLKLAALKGTLGSPSKQKFWGKFHTRTKIAGEMFVHQNFQ